jgi:hypothetical protein
VTRSNTPKKRITFEIMQGSVLSDADFDFMAKLVARAICRNIETERSVTPEKGGNCEFESETEHS